ncbi:NAD-dependent epimerase/dehydratase family protein [Candidatus Riflebacteria bacterium]
MKILVIGGTGFIGPYVVRDLIAAGHQVTLFHRNPYPEFERAAVQHILGNRSDLIAFKDEFIKLAPDVVLDMIPFSEDDSKAVVQTFRGIAGRIVAISSCDVYRAYGILRGTEGGPLQAVPLTESSAVRKNRFPYRNIDKNSTYEKILVEETMLNCPDLHGTILRLPMVYGPKDKQHRMYQYLKRMQDRRPVIILEQGFSMWRWTRGYVEDVAHAIILAVTDEQALGEIFNVGERNALDMKSWVGLIARSYGWNGDVLTLTEGRLPEELKPGINTAQHLETDTTKIRKVLGYEEQLPAEEAIRRTIEWELKNPPEKIDRVDYDYELEDKILSTKAVQ